VKFTVVALGLICCIAFAFQPKDLRTDHYTLDEINRRQEAYDQVDAAQRNEREIEKSIRVAHGMVDFNESKPCQPYDVETTHGHDTITILHLIPEKNSKGECGPEGEVRTN
jgi:hypothetical protein